MAESVWSSAVPSSIVSLLTDVAILALLAAFVSSCRGDHALAAFIHAKSYYTLRFFFAIMVGRKSRFSNVALRFKNFPPANPDDFERLCLRLLKAHWNLPSLELYGRRGERQHGVDIIDMSGAEALRAAQCKLYDERGTLPPAEIQAEVNAAKEFPLPLGVYAICTTARVSTARDNPPGSPGV